MKTTYTCQHGAPEAPYVPTLAAEVPSSSQLVKVPCFLAGTLRALYQHNVTWAMICYLGSWYVTGTAELSCSIPMQAGFHTDRLRTGLALLLPIESIRSTVKVPLKSIKCSYAASHDTDGA